MKIYNYNDQGYFTNENIADESPLEPGVFLLPRNATTVIPIKFKEGFLRKFDGKIWVYEVLPELVKSVPTQPNPYAIFNKITWVWETDWLKAIRDKRNILLQQSDSYLLEDFPLPSNITKQTILDYRKSLRDFPSTIDVTKLNDINEVIFPKKPI